MAKWDLDLIETHLGVHLTDSASAAFSTPQEEFWSGEFGDDYMERNAGAQLVAANTALFAKILQHAPGVSSVLEIGANIGLNIRALQTLLPPPADFTGVEINRRAAEVLAETGCNIVHGSVLDAEDLGEFDLVFTKGVLIHISPERLPDVYDRMAAASSKYLVVAEYYNPVPVAISYRGHDDRLFKRDFAGELLDRHPEFELVSTGFAYHRGDFPQDDTTWFVMRRR